MEQKSSPEESNARARERMAKRQAKEAEKAAQRAQREKEKEELRIAKLREYERIQKEANEAQRKANEERERAVGQRKMEITEEFLSLEERRDKEIERMHAFYDAKLDKAGHLSIEINNFKMIELLKRLGFYRYDQPGGGFEYVQIKYNKIRLVRNVQEIIDAFEDYVRDLPERSITLLNKLPEGDMKAEHTIYGKLLLEKMYKNINYYFSSTLPRLRPDRDMKIETIHDTKHSKYLFYNNVVLRITKDGVEGIEYEDLQDRLKELHEDNGKYIWESNIIDRDYVGPTMTNPIDKPHHDADIWGEFGKFVLLISGIDDKRINYTIINTYKKYRIDTALIQEFSVPERRFLALQSIIGYLLHDNFDTNLKCVLLTDAVQMNGQPSGGTGKGILGKALGHMLNRGENDHKYVNVNGKDFDPKNERRYSDGDITTQLVHIEDAEKDINFEDLFFDVTEGATFRKMYQDKTKHQVKMMISTNTPFDLTAESTKRRIALFELDNYFNADKTPQDVFGHMFFGTDWSKQDWMQFDTFMVSCCEFYMRYGLIPSPVIGYKENIINQRLRPEFVAWFKEYVKPAIESDGQTEFRYDMLAMWTAFVQKYPDTFNRRNTLTESCKFWLKTMGIRSGIYRGTSDALVIYPDPSTNITNWFVQ